ncbi:PD-(D/E)XK motif protein [Peribacillus frigoritolerans]|uniref:PD-(D/E)XK motif protein n=1 Tax=Peribacillus frigoritolerans TaxID=450367 RepID=UPI003D094FA1
MMMTLTKPWENIRAGAERLVDANLKYEICWGVEKNGDYALYIPIEKEEDLPNIDINLKDIEINIFKRDIPNTYQWVIILKRKEAWGIFKRLCEDLMSVAEQAKNEKSMIVQIQNRLKGWQSLLSKNMKVVFSTEQQMGLITELKCLQEIIAIRIDYVKAIQAWVGAEADKQDFLLDNSVVEVKSYRTSKGEKVTISSKDQLSTEKDYLYLITYALTKSENGENVKELIDGIKEQLIISDANEAIEIFETKLWNYGYSSLMFKESELDRYLVDKVNCYRVEGDFPRIGSSTVAPEIVSLNYKVDLTTCTDYLINIDEIVF